MKKALWAIVASAVLLILLTAILVSEESSESDKIVRAEASYAEDSSARKLVFLLQYIGKDYGEAVEDGKVVDTYEYHEMLEFSEAVIAGYARLHGASNGVATKARLQRLQRAIASKADWNDIKGFTQELVPELCNELDVRSSPAIKPDPVRGESLYINNCATCHGSTGNGRGPSAEGLDPSPSDFTDVQSMNEAPPFRFYNAVTFGVEGTSMPSYSLGFTEEQSWDVASYLMTLRKGF